MAQTVNCLPLPLTNNMDSLTWLKTEYPAVAEELEQALSLPPIPPDTPGEAIAVLFDDVQLPDTAQLSSDYQPDLLTFYANGSLIFVKAKGEMLLNRLPVTFPALI